MRKILVLLALLFLPAGLAAQDNPVDHAEPRTRKFKNFDADVTILNAAGEQHHQFVEGEPFTVRVQLVGKTAAPDATIAIGLRDELGREIGGRTMRGVTFAEGESTIADPPLRNGLFQVDVGVADSAAGTELLSHEAVETLSIYGQRSESGGPVQLGGDWTIS